MKIVESPMKVTYFMLQLDQEDFLSPFKDALKILVPPRARSYSGGSKTFYISNIYKDRVLALMQTYSNFNKELNK